MRFRIVIEALIRDLLVPIAKTCVSLDQQFLTEEKAIRITNQPEASQLLHIQPDEIAGGYDIIYVGSSVDALANKEMNRERFLQAFHILVNHPLYEQDTDAQLALIRKLLEAMEIKDIESILPAPPQPLGMAGAESQMMPGLMPTGGPAQDMALPGAPLAGPGLGAPLAPQEEVFG